MMREKITLFLFLLIFPGLIPAQNGSFLLVGGGYEQNGPESWSTPAFTWAAQGKKVAVIGMSASGGYVSYFLNQCNASYVKEFGIATRDSANSQITFDTLIAYDMLFFRGGDQWDYYSRYKGTKLEEAVDSVYRKGGTIGGTSAGLQILSKILFTAEHGTVYPDECLENPLNYYLTLADDFLPFFPDVIFDSHLSERGRFPRTIGFMANWQLTRSSMIIGIGLDDLTCMTVDANGIGMVYGTGCAKIYKAMSVNTFDTNNGLLIADSVTITQLLDGCTYDFNTGNHGSQSLTSYSQPESLEETGCHHIYLSGSDVTTDNTEMLQQFIDEGNPDAGILIITGTNTSLAGSIKNLITSISSVSVTIGHALTIAGNDPVLQQLIIEAEKILFAGNTASTLNAFMETANGILLDQRLHDRTIVLGFVGSDAQFAGKIVIPNYLTPGAAYYGELIFSEGLGLLKHTIIMPNTFERSDIYENTTTAVPYAMAEHNLRYGIWLYNRNYMKYGIQDSSATLWAYGDAPVMILKNNGTAYGLSTHTSSGNPGTPRMIAGFDSMTLSLIDKTTPYRLGTHIESAIHEDKKQPMVTVIPNPASELIQVKGVDGPYDLMIRDLRGIPVYQKSANEPGSQHDVSRLNPGCYIIQIRYSDTNHEKYGKLIIH